VDLKAYIINLDRRKDRRRKMEEDLRAAAFQYPYEFIQAIDAEDLTPEVMLERGYRPYPRWRMRRSPNRFYRRDLLMGEIACALSHLGAWERAREEGHEYSLILEDDAGLSPTAIDDLGKILGGLREQSLSWDLFYVGRSFRPTVECFVRDRVVVPGYSYGAFAYLLTQPAIGKLCAAGLQNNIIPSDEFLPSFYCDHPRHDIRTLYTRPERFSAYAAVPDLAHVTWLPKTDGAERAAVASDTEHSTSYRRTRASLGDDEIRLTDDPTFSYVVTGAAGGILRVDTHLRGVTHTYGPEATPIFLILQEEDAVTVAQLQAAGVMEPDDLGDLLDALHETGVVVRSSGGRV
jgi:GR25 family glycosyltransferase involved in LPS biosynthesis